MVDVWLFTVDCFSSPCLFPACSLVPCYYIHLVCVKLKQLLVLGSILFSSQPNTNLRFLPPAYSSPTLSEWPC